MKKIILLMVLAISFVFADVEYFGGVSLGKGTLNYSLTAVRNSTGEEVLNTSTKTTGSAITVNVGTTLDKVHRTTLAYTKYNSVENVDVSSVTASYDYVDNTSGPVWRPFIGGSLSMLSWIETTQNTATTTWDASEVSLRSTMVLGRVGIDYVLSTKSFVSLTYSVGLLVNGSTETGFTISGTPYTATVDMNSANQISIGYNHSF